ncbi:hypothetical protein BGX27_007030 [Mortierella sp. AM989]|nr:hypothetical protein BGX27_007030 [Mortierella sp. AM989]
MVGYPDIVTGSFGVSIDGKITKLTTTSTTFPLWSGTVIGASTSTTYKYVKLDSNSQPAEEEKFIRTMQNQEDKTMTKNEFFNREEFIALNGGKLAQVPLVYDPWENSNTKIFEDDSQVATIHLMGDTGLFHDMVAHGPVTFEDTPPMRVDFRYINDKIVHNVNNVKLSLSGKSSMENSKMAFKIKFDTATGQSFFSRPNIKLRSEVSDPTMIREKLYIDVLNAIGVPTQQGVWVRLYFNTEPVGLYLMVDDIAKSFIKQTINHGNNTASRGSLWQMNAPTVEDQAGLVYTGLTSANYHPAVYKLKSNGSGLPTEPMAPLIELMKDLQDFDPNAPNGIGFWEERIDLEGFLRNMAMEYLAGAWDAYWYSGSNYFLYLNPTLSGKYGGSKWQWISTDFDGSFGDGDPTDNLTSYQTYADFTIHDRPMVSKLILKNKDINARFEAILKDIVGWAFKPEALFPRLDAFEKLLAKDVEWDYSINRSMVPGKVGVWTIQDFHQSLSGPVKDMNLGIKPWIEGRAKGLQDQLHFQVEPGTPDRVKRPVHRPKGGIADAGTSASTTTRLGASQFTILTLVSVYILCSNIL